MNRNLIKITAAGLLALGAVSATSCDEETAALITGLLLGEEGGYHSGYNVDDEDLASIEDDIDLAGVYGTDNLPASVDLTQYLPPIGDQGDYGTCVAWATAYNCRTYLNAKRNKLTKSQLASSANQFSPKDIFLSISNNDKGADCGGTNFDVAFKKMISRGVATMEDSPYVNLGNCSQAPASSLTEKAARHKINSYREIKVDRDIIKSYLAQGKLVVFGAELGDEFMMATGNTVITKQTTFKLTGQHAYHAMVLSGYDDHVGTHGAFRVVNSWGTSWGDRGYVWVDQDFFVGGRFCYCAFVAFDTQQDDNSVQVDDGGTVVNQTSGMDLISTDLSFFDSGKTNNSGERLWESRYDVYNAGNQTIAASNDWAICLLYYNSKNANDYGIIFVDLYTDKLGPTGEGWWDPVKAYQTLGVPAEAYAWQNVNVKGGQRVNAACGGTDAFRFQYTLPDNLNGDYYLCLMADAFNDVSESNEDNNYLFYNNTPITFRNGVPVNLSKSISMTNGGKIYKQNDESPCQDVRSESNLNAYTPQEIQAMINHAKKTGAISKMAQEWLANRKPDPSCRKYTL
ncbi:MAG: C1 family peptidase [Bacteroidales bacterium]|nr:C1 family peptidase [Bacteroidales bacterium]